MPYCPTHIILILFNLVAFSSGGEAEQGRSRRSLASVDSAHSAHAPGGHYETDPDKLQHPPNITPVGGVPNLKVITSLFNIASPAISFPCLDLCYQGQDGSLEHSNRRIRNLTTCNGPAFLKYIKNKC